MIAIPIIQKILNTENLLSICEVDELKSFGMDALKNYLQSRGVKCGGFYIHNVYIYLYTQYLYIFIYTMFIYIHIYITNRDL